MGLTPSSNSLQLEHVAMSYRLEYSPNNRAACKAPEPCKGTKLTKGELRIGTMVTIMEHQSWQWRHWGCVTSRQLANMSKVFNSASELDGYEDLRPEDQAKIDKAFEDGHVDPDDVPESAKKPEDDEAAEGEGDESPAKRKKPAAKKSKKAKEEEGAPDEAEEKKAAPKKRAAPAKKAKKEEAESEEEAKPPAKKRGRPAKKAAEPAESAEEEEVPLEEEEPKKKKRVTKKKKGESDDE